MLTKINKFEHSCTSVRQDSPHRTGALPLDPPCLGYLPRFR